MLTIYTHTYVYMCVYIYIYIFSFDDTLYIIKSTSRNYWGGRSIIVKSYNHKDGNKMQDEVYAIKKDRLLFLTPLHTIISN